MKKLWNACFHLKVTKDTLVALVSALMVIGLSLAMLLFQKDTVLDEMMSVLLRDVLMMLVVGFWFVLDYVLIRKKESLAVLGIRREKLKLSLILNVVFAIALLCCFLKEGKTLNLNYGTICAVIYILVAGVFEMMFIYGFIHHFFEEAFGIIPAILLTSLFYSLHHAGFQPEFIELFFVGVLYSSVIYITKNIFIIFPFFWGVGAIWDVLVDSTAGNGINNTFSLVVAIGVFLGMLVIGFTYSRKIKKGSN